MDSRLIETILGEESTSELSLTGSELSRVIFWPSLSEIMKLVPVDIGRTNASVLDPPCSDSDVIFFSEQAVAPKRSPHDTRDTRR
jgi:hypothetical protein